MSLRQNNHSAPIGLDSLAAWRVRVREPCLTAYLVVQAAFAFGAGPLASFGWLDPNLATGILVIATVLLVLMEADRYGPMLVAIGSLLLASTGLLVRMAHPSEPAYVLAAAGVILALLSVSWVVVRVVFNKGRVTRHRIYGAIVLYLNIALSFAAVYRLVAELIPGAFTGASTGPLDTMQAITYINFSLAALTTIGSNTVAPIHDVARSLRNLEAVIGQLYPAIILSRLVTLYSARDFPE
jgi:hypothetical protein